jgi:hypothetical protein
VSTDARGRLTVTIPDGFPHAVGDDQLAVIVDEAAKCVSYYADRDDLNNVLKYGELLDLARGEDHRRALRRADEQSKWALRVAIGSLVIATVVGIAQIVVQTTTSDRQIFVRIPASSSAHAPHP